MKLSKPPASRRDIVVIGASAGGVNAVSAILRRLPANLGAAVFVVIHQQPGPSRLPDLLSARSGLRATHALHGETIEPNHVYIAPPDNHLLVRKGHVEVVRSARENGHRPSIDILFQSASNAYGPRVIGVVLTGHRDCGTAGLLSIKARGGTAVVQFPQQAAAPDMPRSAIEHVDVDHVATLEELPDIIVRLIREHPQPTPDHLPSTIAELEGTELGSPSEIVCPVCNGHMTETEINRFRHFRCHVGHAFSLQGLTMAQADAVERAMWAAARALEESASLAGRVAGGSIGDLKTRMAEKQEQQIRHAELIRHLILDGSDLTRPDADALGSKSGSGRALNPKKEKRRRKRNERPRA